MSNSMVASPNPVPDAHPPIGARVMLTENVTIDSNDYGQPQVFDAGQRGTVEDLYDQMLWVKLDGTHAGISETGGCLVFHLPGALPVQVLSEDVELDDLITTVREKPGDIDQTPTERPRLKWLEPEDVDLSFLGTEPLPGPPQIPTPQAAQTRLAFSPEVVAVNAILLQRDALQARQGCESAAHRYNVRLRNLARTLARHAAEEEEPSLAEALPPLRALALAVMLMMVCGVLGKAGSLHGQGALDKLVRRDNGSEGVEAAVSWQGGCRTVHGGERIDLDVPSQGGCRLNCLSDSRRSPAGLVEPYVLHRGLAERADGDLLSAGRVRIEGERKGVGEGRVHVVLGLGDLGRQAPLLAVLGRSEGAVHGELGVVEANRGLGAVSAAHDLRLQPRAALQLPPVGVHRGAREVGRGRDLTVHAGRGAVHLGAWVSIAAAETETGEKRENVAVVQGSLLEAGLYPQLSTPRDAEHAMARLAPAPFVVPSAEVSYA